MRSDWRPTPDKWANYAKYPFCVYCAQDLAMLLRAGLVAQVTLDHIKARAESRRNGEHPDHSDANIAPACHACNSRRRDMPLDEFIALDKRYAGAQGRIATALAAKADYKVGYELWAESRTARGLDATIERFYGR